MRALIAAVVVAATLAACSDGTGGAPADAVFPAGPTPLHTTRWDGVHGPGSLRTLSLPVRDPDTKQHRDVIVYTPDVADPDALPVLYLLHGLPGTASDLCSPAMASALDAAFARGVTPFEVACPDGSGGTVNDNEWADSVDGSTTLETFVTGEVRTAVEGEHPRLPAMRAIGGFSMGGFGAAALGLRHSGLYGSVVALAGYFHLDDPDHVFGQGGATQQAHDPQQLVARARGQCWFLAEAADDTLALTAHAAEEFAGPLRRAGAVVDLERTPGEHSPGWAVSQLVPAAQFLARCWGSP